VPAGPRSVMRSLDPPHSPTMALRRELQLTLADIDLIMGASAIPET
jgi:hypothetical protein